MQRIYNVSTGTFVDLPDEVEAPEPIASIRARTTMPRATFCVALFQAGILSESDAVFAQRGGWPDSFAGVLAAMPDALARVQAQVTWAEALNIQRMSPLFLSVLSSYAAVAGLTEPQAVAFGDQMFGITA